MGSFFLRLMLFIQFRTRSRIQKCLLQLQNILAFLTTRHPHVQCGTNNEDSPYISFLFVLWFHDTTQGGNRKTVVKW